MTGDFSSILFVQEAWAKSSKFEIPNPKEIRNSNEQNVPNRTWMGVLVQFEVQDKFVRIEYFRRGSVEKWKML